MSTYELPDGFEGMETAPKNTLINLVFKNGLFNNDCVPSVRPILGEPIGWSPIVPPKKKRRFVVCDKSFYGPFAIYDTLKRMNRANSIPTRESAQAVADIYEQAYEGGV